MASRKRNLICVLFSASPPGTHFSKGSHSWVNAPEALDYIEAGHGIEYDPVSAREHHPEPEEPQENLPDDLPGKRHFLKAGITEFEEVKDLKDFDEISGIGQSTENKIIAYLEDN